MRSWIRTPGCHRVQTKDFETSNFTSRFPEILCGNNGSGGRRASIGCLQQAEAPPNNIYYVRKDGNDTSGDGSTSAPWLTLSKALSVAGNRDLVKVGNGLYEETTKGAGYWNIDKTLSDYLAIEAERGE